MKAFSLAEDFPLARRCCDNAYRQLVRSYPGSYTSHHDRGTLLRADPLTDGPLVAGHPAAFPSSPG